MVVAVFPLVKIGLLLMKQLSKPMANIIKNRAKRHPQMRKYVIVPIGRAYRWVENRASIGFRRVKPHEIEQVTEEEAIELGANAVGEIILFGLLCLILLAELSRQGDKKAVIEQTKAEEITNLQDTVLDLNEEVNNLKKLFEDFKHALENPPDLFDLEDQRHQQVTDHNFWDIFGTKKRRNGPKFDDNSPSI